MELPLRNFFEAPTVTGLAQAVEAARRAESLNPSVPIPLARVVRLFPYHLRSSGYGSFRSWLRIAPPITWFQPSAFWAHWIASALEKSLNATTARHESLRTTFPIVGGQPVQVIARVAPVELPVSRLTELPRMDRLDEAIRLAKKESEKPPDLEGEHLFRALLYRLEQDDHLFCLSMHHINSDQWSMQVLGRDILAFYEAYRTSATPALLDLPIQYADYANWQRSELPERMLDPALAYWKKQLDGLPVLELPTDFPRPAVQSYSGAWYSFN